LEQAGFSHLATVEIDPDACETLKANRPKWNVVMQDIHDFDPSPYHQIDLFAGGVPCPPFSIAGKQLGADDDRDLFPRALKIIEDIDPTAVMLENVRGLATARFASYREQVLEVLHGLGYETEWQILNASAFGVPQLRPRFILVAMKPAVHRSFRWPNPLTNFQTVGESLRTLMAASGWRGVDAWVKKANDIGPTLVGGSRKHGGPDLGPTRARQAWLELGVDGRGIADKAPSADQDVDYLPRLTLEMTAVLQGFPETWHFSGRKTAAYRQIGNAFPPPVAYAVGKSIRTAIVAARELEQTGSEHMLKAV
jgi:DNA (cytosine-5)-methyltransferase 1